MSTEKVVRDGRVAVLVSPGFGAGWSTWFRGNDRKGREWMVFSPEVVAWVEAGKPEGQIVAILKARFGEHHPYAGGARDLEIEWVPQGEAFEIREYDGSETLELRGEVEWHIA